MRVHNAHRYSPAQPSTEIIMTDVATEIPETWHTTPSQQSQHPDCSAFERKGEY